MPGKGESPYSISRVIQKEGMQTLIASPPFLAPLAAPSITMRTGGLPGALCIACSHQASRLTLLYPQ